MKRLLTLLIGIAALAACSTQEMPQADYDVIPLPRSVARQPGRPFVLKPSTKIYAPRDNAALRTAAELLSEYIEQFTGLELKVTHEERSSNILKITVGAAGGNPESYTLRVTDAAVEITGGGEAGAFYGVQTLRKSLPLTTGGRRIALPPVTIEDAPRFGYRGLHLDVARHMFPVAFIKKYLDLMALHNINTFHWHLTDDQGWRIEIRKYPRLAEISSQRKETLVSHWEKPGHKYDATPYGGYYTQDEIREVVAYAAARHIDVIPEIDLPGHMLAVLAAYPELGCTGGPYETGTRWGVYDDVLCAGNDKTYEFLEGVFSEIVELFPYKYVHLGGDECPKVRWKACPKCQARIRTERLTADAGHSREEQLQSYMMSRVGDFLKSHGKSIIGWDEILEGGGMKDVTVMSWRGEEGGIAAAENGLDAIITASPYLYFDYAQSHDEGEPLCVGGYIPVRKVYDYDPLPAKLAADPTLAKHIIGVQANLWTEYFRDSDVVEYMVIPRIDALAEIQWTDGKHKDYAGFLERLNHMRAIYDKMGYTYASHVFE